MQYSRSKRILYRIIIPFGFLLISTTLITSVLSAYIITRYLDQDSKRQMERVARVISQSAYAMNPAILSQLKGLLDAEIVIFTREGKILSSTRPESGIREQMKEMPGGFSGGHLSDKSITLDGSKHRVIIRPVDLPGYRDIKLALLFPVSNEEILRNRIAVTIGITAFFGILAMSVLAFYIARTITSPVEKLVQFSEKVAQGNLNDRIDVKADDEIGVLAASFNTMVDRIRAYEVKLVETEKLATAGQMAAGMAHEIRNPLTSIKMMVQVLESRLRDDSENKGVFSSLVKEINRLDGIIQGILNKTRPGELVRKWSDIRMVAEDVLAIARESLEVQGITIERNLSEEVPKLFIDQEKMKQVFWNLILNAKEAMPKGGKITFSADLADSAVVEVSIRDTGMGVSEENCERLFLPFFTTKPEGVGLGLSMSRKIVEKHGGSLTVENAHGGGAIARMILPLQEEKR